MDRLLRRSERAGRTAPGDLLGALSTARRLTRAGRPDRARSILREQLAARRIAGELLEAVKEAVVTADPAAHTPTAHAPARMPWRFGVRGGERALLPTVAVAGPRELEIGKTTLELLRTFGGRPLRPGTVARARCERADDQPLLDVEVTLAAPWALGRGLSARALRLVTLPDGPAAGKLRRELLASTSALLIVADGRLGLARFAELAAALDADCRRAQARPLTALPARVHYAAAEAAAEHAALSEALTLGRPAPLGRLTGPGAAIDGLALLLHDLSAAARGLVRPRRS